MEIVLYDVDTQNDFINDDGALTVKAEHLKKKIKQLVQFSKKSRFQIIGSVDRHFGTEEYKNVETELERNGGTFPDHCMDGTEGQQKIKESISGNDIIYVPSRNADFDAEDISGYIESDIYFEKQTYDVFSENGGNPNLELYLETICPDIILVFGVATNICVQAAIDGLIKLGYRTCLVMDAIKGLYIDADNNEKTALTNMILNNKCGVLYVEDIESLIIQ